MEQAIRNKLRNVVTQCRKLLEEAVSHELQGRFGIHASPKKEEVVIESEEQMTNLSDEERTYRKELIDHYEHIRAFGSKPKDALAQLIREIAFTHLNRLCAYKMMEARDIYIGGQKFREAVSRGVNSNGVKFYLADHPDDERLFSTGHQDIAYRHFLDWLGGQLSEEIGILFNPNDSANRLYPPQRVLDDVLALINDEELAGIWSQDETIGWVYQYFTPKELRDQARKESAAPRNSYELAFRNQFFTPRYVVEFLTDNTLGRIWYEMRKGDTKLKDQCRYMVRRPNEIFLAEGQQPSKDTDEERDDLSQEELLKQPVYIPHRPKKDPRELKILDPACGSGHFLLYCFDLLLTIYEEAYGDSDLGPVLQKDYPALGALQKAMPGLILKHNPHGIDIDLRCTQIAALALWLRCQRAYQEMGLKKDRPKITRSNIVCAEPMPGEQAMLKEFMAQLEPKLLGQLVEVVFDKMKLAGEAGSLLKIEEEIRDAVATAKRQWLAGPVAIQLSLFGENQPKVHQQTFDFSGITDNQFFEQAESKVVEALRMFTEQSQNGKQLQRRLFADDAVRGFAFVDLCRKQFDAVLMNPPFGDASNISLDVLEDQLAHSGREMGSAFLAAGNDRWAPEGCVGAVLSSTPLFKPTFTQWRQHHLFGKTASLSHLAHFGGEILDGATVSASALVTTKRLANNAVFFRLIRCEDKQEALHEAIDSVNQARPCRLALIAALEGLSSLTGSPLAYWISKELQGRLASLPPFEGSGGTVKQGTATADEFRFSRAWWEVSACSSRWMPYTKTSEYSPFWDDPTWVLNFANDGEEIRSTGKARVQGTGYFGTPGVTYPSKSVLGFNPRVHPRGGAFGHTGSVAFPKHISAEALLGFLASRPTEYALSLFVGSLQGEAGFHPLHYEVGVIQRLPVPSFTETSAKVLHEAATISVLAVRRLFFHDETSHDFIRTVTSKEKTIAATTTRLSVEEEDVFAELVRQRRKIDEIVAKAYGFSSKDLEEMEAEFSARVPPASGRWRRYFEAPADPIDIVNIATAVVSYAVGAVFGRWDIRFSVHDGQLPQPKAAFAPLPRCSVGMLQNSEGLLATEPPNGYPLCIDWDGILVDDPDHPDDIIRRTREVFEVIWKDRADAIEKEARETLGVKELRDYFRKPGKGGFWDDHVSRYTKSRRKAPIYWLLQSSRKNYALWIYYHRLDKDILFKALLNYVEPKIRLEQSRLDSLRTQKQAAGETDKGSKKLDKEIEQQDDLLSELRDFEDKLRRAANLHLDPDLNDGVVLNIAPLHELVPWKEAKSYWEDLLAGKYEWSSIGKQLREKGVVR